MPNEEPDTTHRCPARRRPDVRRWTLVGLGASCVGLGAVGVVVPGMPTTVFLLAASWCFTRSCPWLEQRLIRNRFFGPYLAYLDSGQPMPARAMWATLVVMWTAIALSTWMLLGSETSLALVASIPAFGAIGTAFVVRAARPGNEKGAPASDAPSAVCPVMQRARAGSANQR